jgi:hypothetical protein
VGWYSQSWRSGQVLRERFNQLESAEDQLALIDAWFLEAIDQADSFPDEPFIVCSSSLPRPSLN